MAEKRCLACGENLEELTVFHNMPKSAQEFPTKEELATEKGMDLSLCQCRSCGLVQFDTEAVPYYKDVIRAGGGSSTMKAGKKGRKATFDFRTGGRCGRISGHVVRGG